MMTAQAEVRARPGSVLAAATILSLPLGSIYAFSVLLAPLEQLFQASRSDLASVFSISAVFMTVGTNVGPWLFGRVRASVLIALTGALSALGVILAAVAPTFGWLVFGYGLLFATGGGMAYIGIQQAVNAAPLTRPGLVNGYLVCLFPLGAMLAAPAFGVGLDWFGVRLTLFALAAVVGASVLASAGLIARSGVVLTKTSRSATSKVTVVHHGLRTTFRKLFCVFFLAASAGLMVLSQAASMVATFGASTSTAVLATTGITAAIAAARLFGGLLTDRLPVPVVATAAQAVAFLGALTLTVLPSPAVAIFTLGLIGVGYGLISGVTFAAVAFYWPKEEFGRIAGRFYIAWCLAATVLPVLAGYLYDLTSSYRMAIIVAGGANLLAVFVASTLPRQGRTL